MARVLIVGCGCRGRELATALLERGHAVRGTTRRPEALAEIEAAGAEAVLADPDRLATLSEQLDGVSVLCWLLGSASAEALHAERLGSLLEHLVDTPVRGVVYERSGVVPSGAALVERARTTFRIRAELVAPAAAAAELAAAVELVLAS